MRESVVFLHGIWMTGLELGLLRRRVRRCGFDCHQFRYHSVLRSPQETAARLDEYLRDIDADVVHFVGHSLGGLVLMHLFDRYPLQRPGRVVLLATPLKGSAVAASFGRYFFTRPLLGRSILRGLLGDAPRWKGLRELGMIAGTRGVGLGMMIFGGLEHPNDGTVAVAETRSPEINAHLMVPYSHFGMLMAEPVAALTCGFLKEGVFGRLDETQ
ncbi:MAG: alpha/beta hydrolase [Chromatiales bacterium]|jgi:pimeloyl-ACP methyl ester carboxylesterase